MKLEELKSALADGSLTLADLQAEIDATASTTAPAATVEKPIDDPKEDAPLKAQLQALTDDLAAARAEIKKLGEKPGEAPTVIKPNAHLADLSPEKKALAGELQKFNEEIGAMAAKYMPAGFQTEL